MRRNTLLFFLLLTTKVFCQPSGALEGTVTDEKGNLLSFVHIGSQLRAIGTISDENGNYKLDLSGLQDSDQIRFSIVGYRGVVRSVEQLKMESNVSLKAEPLLLSAVQIEVKRIKSPEFKTLGRSKPTGITTGHSGLNPYGIGTEWALIFNGNDEPMLLKDINFHTKWNSLDSVLYRIAFYTVKDGLPDTTINQQEIWYRSTSGITWHLVDLSPYQFVLLGEFAVSIEIVRKYYSEERENLLFFSHARQSHIGKAFTQSQSQGTWQEGMDFPLTLNVRYLSVSKD